MADKLAELRATLEGLPTDKLRLVTLKKHTDWKHPELAKTADK